METKASDWGGEGGGGGGGHCVYLATHLDFCPFM